MVQTRLFLPRVTDVKLRYYAIQYRTDELADVLGTALERGMPFVTAYPVEYLLKLRGPVDFDEEVLPTYLEDGYVEPVLLRDDDARTSWLQYLYRVRDVLGRPHAVGYLLKGGILWRIALEYGPRDLLDRLVSGPSSYLVRYLRGSRAAVGYLYDSVTESEISVALGVVADPNAGTHKSWWPSDEDFAFNLADVGEWTKAHEEWFKARIAKIANGRAVPQSRHEWNRELRLVGRKARRGRTVPSGETVGRLRQGIEVVLGKWNERDASDLSLRLFTH